VRAKNVNIAYCQSSAGRDYTQQKAWDRELHSYEVVRSEGIQPLGTKRCQVDHAKRVSDDQGFAFDAEVA
jgi:hypothetical protein